MAILRWTPLPMRLMAAGALLAVLVLTGCGGESSDGGSTRARNTPQIVVDAQTAAEQIAAALRSSGYRADFSPRSAWEVDRFFAEQMDAPGRPKRGGPLADAVGAKLFALGGYVGEIVRRHADGWRWLPAADNPDDELNLSLRRGTDVIWPVERVTKRFAEGDENGIAVYVATVAGLDVGPRRR